MGALPSNVGCLGALPQKRFQISDLLGEVVVGGLVSTIYHKWEILYPSILSPRSILWQDSLKYYFPGENFMWRIMHGWKNEDCFIQILTWFSSYINKHSQNITLGKILFVQFQPTSIHVFGHYYCCRHSLARWFIVFYELSIEFRVVLLEASCSCTIAFTLRLLATRVPHVQEEPFFSSWKKETEH